MRFTAKWNMGNKTSPGQLFFKMELALNLFILFIFVEDSENDGEKKKQWKNTLHITGFALYSFIRQETGKNMSICQLYSTSWLEFCSLFSTFLSKIQIFTWIHLWWYNSPPLLGCLIQDAIPLWVSQQSIGKAKGTLGKGAYQSVQAPLNSSGSCLPSFWGQ